MRKNVMAIAVFAISLILVLSFEVFYKSNKGCRITVYGAEAENFKVYEDSLMLKEMTQIYWGSEISSFYYYYRSVYFFNNTTNSLTLTMNTSDWNPQNMSNYITVSWTYDGRVINSGTGLLTAFILKVNETAPNSEFSFNINIYLWEV